MKRKVVNGSPSNELILSSHTAANDAVFPKILDLYVKRGSTVADVTYGKGVFWRRVPPGVYTVLPTDILTGTDCRELPYTEGSIDCVVLDPPYMHSPGGTAHLGHSPFESYYRNNQANGHRGKYHEAVVGLYEDAGIEAFRVLRDWGTMIVKCQDEVCANRQRFTHVEIMQAYGDLGFVAEDLFVVTRMNRPGVSAAKQQVHARKNHSYFLVFWKPPKTKGKKPPIWKPRNEPNKTDADNNSREHPEQYLGGLALE